MRGVRPRKAHYALALCLAAGISWLLYDHLSLFPLSNSPENQLQIRRLANITSMQNPANLAWSPDGEKLAVFYPQAWSRQPFIEIFSTNGRSLQKIDRRIPYTSSKAFGFLNDGTLLTPAPIGPDSDPFDAFAVWNVETGALIRTIPGSPGIYKERYRSGPMSAGVFNPDTGLAVVQISNEGSYSVHFIDLAQGRKISTIEIPRNQFPLCSEHDSSILSIPRDVHLQKSTLGIAYGIGVALFRPSQQGWESPSVFSYIQAAEDGSIGFQLGDSFCRAPRAIQRSLTSVALNPDGMALAVGVGRPSDYLRAKFIEEHFFEVFSIQSQARLYSDPSIPWIDGIEWTHDGRYIAAYSNYSFRIISVAGQSFQQVYRYDSPDKRVLLNHFAITRDGKRFAFSNRDNVQMRGWRSFFGFQFSLAIFEIAD